MSENGRKPVKKISASAAVLLTLKVEVQSLYNRIIISYNRKGHRAFAVFLLSIFVGKCRRAVSDMRCRSPPLHLDFTFQKFGLEDNTVKYAPRKVYIRESGGYVELSYTDFCRCRESDQTYMDKLFIPIQGCLLEVVREQYTDFYRDKERWRYLQKLDVKNGLLSLEGFTDDEGNALDFVVDETVDIAETVANALMVDRLNAALSFLSDSERELIQALFFDGLSERAYAGKKGVSQTTIGRRKNKILARLKKLIENRF